MILNPPIPARWEKKIRAWIQNAAARWEIISRAGDRGEYGLDGRDEDGETWEDDAALFQQYGHRSRPGPRAEGISVTGRGASSQRVLIATRSRQDEPAELADWEVDLYSRFGQRVHLREDEGLIVTTKSGSKAEFLPNGEIVLTSKGGAQVTLDDSTVTSNITHISGAGDPPTGTAELAGLGANGQFSGIDGTDSAFGISVITDPMTAPGGGAVARITFAKPFRGVPYAVAGMQGGDGDAGPFISSISDTEVVIGLQKAPLTNGHTYNINVLVVGTK